MSNTPTLNGQIIGQAEKATRALLNVLLDKAETTFHQWVVLNLLADNGGSLDRGDVVRRIIHGLKVEESVASSTLDEVEALDLVTTEKDRVALATACFERYQQISDGIVAIVDRLYGNLPADDLATAGRVLSIVTERANAELASLR